jgi:hypothetical protein
MLRPSKRPHYWRLSIRNFQRQFERELVALLPTLNRYFARSTRSRKRLPGDAEALRENGIGIASASLTASSLATANLLGLRSGGGFAFMPAFIERSERRERTVLSQPRESAKRAGKFYNATVSLLPEINHCNSTGSIFNLAIEHGQKCLGISTRLSGNFTRFRWRPKFPIANQVSFQ